LSEATLALAEEAGFKWTASGGGVLANSQHGGQHNCRHRVYRFGDSNLDCVFRDDGLSDLIGFQYSSWHAHDAVSDLVGHLENIANHCPDRRNCLVSIILDGENAWEYYPENAWHFLSELYQRLGSHPEFRLTTFSDFLAGNEPKRAHEQKLVAGSWVYGTFSTWIGDPEKNRAWDLLVEAKHCYDRVISSGALDEQQRRRAEHLLAICEGSDWFWWFGDYNPSDTVSQFDQLYRMHLGNLYLALGVEAPESLSEVISRGGGAPAQGGVMRHSEG
jgi:alpha-amylase/alpha-mannosidase (GH57 family)